MDTERLAITEPVRWLEVFTGAGRGGADPFSGAVYVFRAKRADRSS
jgi:hypothetical protein